MARTMAVNNRKTAVKGASRRNNFMMLGWEC
jgi:hypothetical protein